MKRLENKIIMITGGTSGIGEASARLFAKEGASVIIVGRNEDKGKTIEAEIRDKGYKALFYCCDVTQEEDIERLKNYVVQKYGRLDGLFNNAGLLLTNRLENINTMEWKQVYEVNTNAVMYMTRAFVDMIVEARGNILVNASIDGLQSNVRGRATYMYASSKAATIQFTQILALNYSDRIRVNCICPGLTETNLFTNRDFSRFNGTVPIGRMAQSIEIAKAALFLMSDDASYITGSILNVDGGAALASTNTAYSADRVN